METITLKLARKTLFSIISEFITISKKENKVAPLHYLNQEINQIFETNKYLNLLTQYTYIQLKIKKGEGNLTGEGVQSLTEVIEDSFPKITTVIKNQIQ